MGQHPRPIKREFYTQLRADRHTAAVRSVIDITEPGAHLIDVDAGELVIIELPAGPQIVNTLPFNRHDPDERFWAHETCLLEGLWLRRYGRLWGTMARFRPLLTLLDDGVYNLPVTGAPGARHHPQCGGGGTPADWAWSGGDPSAVTTWEQLRDALALRGLPASMIKDNVCLFQKSAIEPVAQRFEILASDARPGDKLVLFAEIDLTLPIALSPYLGGGRPAGELAGERPRPVRVSVTERLAEPLGWPYEGLGYPDLTLYLDASGTRSCEPVPTPGREAIL